MTMLSPLGRVPKQPPQQVRRRRRVLPWLIFVVVFAAAAAVVWSRLISSDDHAQARAACESAHPTPRAVDVHNVQVRVYNATQTTGLAGRVSGGLRTLGFDVVLTGNDTSGRTVTGVGEIRYGQAGARAAALVHAALPGAVLLPDKRTDTVVDIAVGPRFSTLATASAVRSEAAALNVTPRSVCG